MRENTMEYRRAINALQIETGLKFPGISELMMRRYSDIAPMLKASQLQAAYIGRANRKCKWLTPLVLKLLKSGVQ